MQNQKELKLHLSVSENRQEPGLIQRAHRRNSHSPRLAGKVKAVLGLAFLVIST